MSWFKKKSKQAVSDDHALITHIPLPTGWGTPEDWQALGELEDLLVAAASSVGGEFDGNDVGPGKLILYMYGPDADDLFDAFNRSLKDFSLAAGSYAIKRYGRAEDPEAREERVDLP
jgi:hypothetical protein